MTFSVLISTYQGLAFVAIFVCLFTITKMLVLGAPPSARLGLRGMHRQRKLNEPGSWRRIEPAVRWLGARVNGLLDDQLRSDLDVKLTMAGDPLGIVPEELIALCIIAGAGGLLFGLAINAMMHIGLPMVIGCAALGGSLPYSQLGEAKAKRFKLIGRGLPGAIDLLALGMSAGLDFPGALLKVVEKSATPGDPLIDELTYLLQGLQLGQTRVQVLRRFAERVPTEIVQDFVGAVVQAEERGNPVAPVLLIQAEVARQRRSVRAEEQAAKAGTNLVIPMSLMFVCVLLLVAGPIVLKLMQEG
jgi:tight adherence protein C